MGLWFWKMLSGLRDCYFGGCLSSKERFEFFWKVELSSVATQLANQPKVQCHQTSSHLHRQGCHLTTGHISIIDQPFVDTLFFLLYYSWVLTCFCGKLVFDIVHSDIVHHVRTFCTERATTQHGQSPEVIQVLYIKVLSIVPNRALFVDVWCFLRSLGQRKRRAAVQKSATGSWWLFSCL